MNDLKETIRPFYTQCLTVNAGVNVAEIMGNLLADDFQSLSSIEVKNKATLIGQVQYFWKLIPNLNWEIQEMLQDGNRVIVRSLASGSPQGDFMGVATTGKKSFKIMTIDIHTVLNGKIVKVYHLEDWPTAMKQLQG
jgi:predicted ester cyclase